MEVDEPGAKVNEPLDMEAKGSPSVEPVSADMGNASIKQAIQLLCHRLDENMKVLVLSVSLTDYSSDCLGSDWALEYVGLYPEVTEKFQQFCKDKCKRLDSKEQHCCDDRTVDDAEVPNTARLKQKTQIENVPENDCKLRAQTTRNSAPAKVRNEKETNTVYVVTNTRPRRKSALKFLASIKREVIHENPACEKSLKIENVCKNNSEHFARKRKSNLRETEKESKRSVPDGFQKTNTSALTKDKSKECEICERSFRNLYALISHRRTHKAKPEETETVSKAKARKQKSEASISPKHTPENKVPEKVPKLTVSKASEEKNKFPKNNTTEQECENCGAKFKKMSALISHSKTHKVKLEQKESFKLESEDSVENEVDAEGMSVTELKEEGQMPPVPVSSVMVRVFKKGVNIYMYECRLCDEACRRRDKILRHLRNSHADKVGFQCQVCRKAFREKVQLEKHVSSHAAEHSCDKCGRSYTTMQKLRHHLRIHNLDLFPCDKCDKIYKVKHLLARHKESVHDGVRFPCSECKKSFTRLPTLKEHQQNKHFGTKPPVVECSMCDKKYASRDNLRIHVNNIHKKQFRHICDVCGLKFPNNTRLSIHHHLHTGELPFKCEHCDKAYRRKDSLLLHQKLHSGNDFCMCDVCGKSFSQKGNLNHHRRFHNNEYKPYSCPYCSEKFRTATAYRTHILRTHKAEDLASGKSIILVCKFCPKLFSHKEHLKAHENIHQGLKPYKCSICHKGFSDRSNLRQHKTVHNRQKIACGFCSKGFSTLLLLKNHIFRCHQDIDLKDNIVLVDSLVDTIEANDNLADVDTYSTEPTKCENPDNLADVETYSRESNVETYSRESTKSENADICNDNTATVCSDTTVCSTATAIIPMSVADAVPASSGNMEQMTVYFDESSAVVALVTMDDTQDTENATKQLEELLFSVQAEPSQNFH